LWHSLDKNGNIDVYDVKWPDGSVETNIPTMMLEGVKEGSHHKSEAHGEQSKDTSLKERRKLYKKV
jgi:hypothetical protein